MTISPDRYTSPAWLAQELERVFGAAWLLTAHSSELEGPGAFVVVELGGESILLLRGSDGAAQAYFNVCQHRGAVLCTEARGRASSHRCPYHHWEYGLDGRLLAAPGAGQAVKLPEGGVSLQPLGCLERFGFVWISMARTPVDLDAWLAPVAPELSRYRPEEYRLVDETVVEVDANWKASVDINNESYHLASLHPALLEVFDVNGVRCELRGDHSVMALELGKPSREGGSVGASMRGLLSSFGVSAFDGHMLDVQPAIVRAARARAARTGVDLSRLSDAQLTSKQQVHVFPNAQFNFLPFSLEVYRHRPHPTDPGRCLFDEWTFDRPGNAPHPAPRRRRFRHGEQPLGPVMGADVDMLPRLQRGMGSRGFRELRLAPGEESIAHLHAVLDGWLTR